MGQKSRIEKGGGTDKIIRVVTGLPWIVKIKMVTRKTCACVSSAPPFNKVDSLTSNAQEHEQSVADGYASNSRPCSDGTLAPAIRKPQEGSLRYERTDGEHQNRLWYLDHCATGVVQCHRDGPSCGYDRRQEFYHNSTRCQHATPRVQSV